MEETNNIKRERREVQATEPWVVDSVREILIATGRVSTFDLSDLAADDLREIVGNVQHAKRMREPDFSIQREGGQSPSSTLISDEVMKW